MSIMSLPITSLMITDREMQAGARQDRARQLCQDIPEIRRYQGTWWLAAPEGWLRITDCYLSERLDHIQERLGSASGEYSVAELSAEEEAVA